MEEDPDSLYSYDQWDEDNVDLSFQTVPDLIHLLPDRDDQLDHHLYQQAVILLALLRKVGAPPIALWTVYILLYHRSLTQSHRGILAMVPSLKI